VGAVGDSFARCGQPGRRATNGGGPSPGRASPIGGVPPGSRLGSRQSCADLDSLVPSDGAPRRVGFFLGPGHGRQSVAARGLPRGLRRDVVASGTSRTTAPAGRVWDSVPWRGSTSSRCCSPITSVQLLGSCCCTSALLREPIGGQFWWAFVCYSSSPCIPPIVLCWMAAVVLGGDRGGACSSGCARATSSAVVL